MKSTTATDEKSIKFTTDADVKSMKFNPDGNNKHKDTVVRGLTIEVSSSETRMFRYQYTSPVTKTQKTYTFGEYCYKNYRLAKARADLKRLKQYIRDGNCPQTEKNLAKIKPESKENKTLKEVIELFLQAKSELATHKVYCSNLRKKVPSQYLHIPIRDITKEHIRDILKTHNPNHHATRRKFQTILKSLFSWLYDEDYTKHNVAKDIKYMDKIRKRERVLEPHELKIIWHEFGEYGYPFGDALKMLTLTAIRRTKIAEMAWKDIDFVINCWTFIDTKPSGTRKTKVHLSPTAMDIITHIRDNNLHKGSKYVFTARNGQPIQDFAYALSKTRERANLSEHWHIHDLRRTLTTLSSRNGLMPNPEVKKAILNHSQLVSGATASYDMNDFYNDTKQVRQDFHDWLFYQWGEYDHLVPNANLLSKHHIVRASLNYIESLPEPPSFKTIRKIFHEQAQEYNSQNKPLIEPLFKTY